MKLPVDTERISSLVRDELKNEIGDNGDIQCDISIVCGERQATNFSVAYSNSCSRDIQSYGAGFQTSVSTSTTCSSHAESSDSARSQLETSTAISSMNMASNKYLIYSISKVFIATVVMSLAERGRLNLDEGLGPVLPEVCLHRDVTLRHLLGHRSGLPDYGGIPEYHSAVKENPGSAWEDSRYFDLINSTAANRPGQAFRYSNLGYFLLRKFIERLFDKNLKDIVRDEITTPCGLKSTYVATERSDLNDLVRGWSTYLGGSDSTQDVRRVYDPGWVSHGVLVSTPIETAGFLSKLLAGEIVGKSALQEMKSAVEIGEDHPVFDRPSVGLGLLSGTIGTDTIIYGHSGSGPGWSVTAFELEHPDCSPQPTVAVFLNSELNLLPELILSRIATLLQN